MWIRTKHARSLYVDAVLECEYGQLWKCGHPSQFEAFRVKTRREIISQTKDAICNLMNPFDVHKNGLVSGLLT